MVEVDPVILAGTVAGTVAIATIIGVLSCNNKKEKDNKDNNNKDNKNKSNNNNQNQNKQSNKDDNKKKDKKDKKENKKDDNQTQQQPAQQVQQQQVKQVKQVKEVVTSLPTPPSTTSPKQTKQSKTKNNQVVTPAPEPAPVVTPVVAAPQPTKASGKAAKAAKVVETPVAPPAPAPQVSTKSQAKAAPAPAPQAPAPAPEPTPVATDSTGEKKKKAKETPEQKAARLERQKKKKEEQAASTSENVVESSPVVERVEFVARAPVSDGWEVVDRKPKTKKAQPTTTNATSNSTSATSDANNTPVVAAPEQQSSKLTIDAKKIGIIIGPKGATLRAIQDLTEATLNFPKDRDSHATSVSITIAGSNDAVQNASNIVIELCTKGYSPKLEGDNFQESSISVHNQYLSEIIGKNGSSIRAMQEKFGVRITVPPSNSKNANDLISIGIAGDRENISRTKDVIRDIMTFYHSPITHPGYVHASLDIPSRFYNNIIGTRGSEIRHIQNNFKVAVHIPSSTTLNQTLLVVGENSHNVDNAVRYIQKIVQQVTNDEINNAVVAETWDEQSKIQTGDEDEEWMSQYMYNRNSNKAVDLMNALNVPISLPTAESNAWKIADSAEGW